MNTLKKMATGVVLGMLALSATAPARAAEVAGLGLPDLSAITSQASEFIARELKAQLRAALQVPRPVRVRTPPSVEIIEGAEVVVEASRLPPLDGPKQANATQTTVRL